MTSATFGPELCQAEESPQAEPGPQHFQSLSSNFFAHNCLCKQWRGNMSGASKYDANGGQSSADHARTRADGGHGGANDDDNDIDGDWVLDAYRAVCRDAARPPTVRGLAAWRDHVLRSCLRASRLCCCAA
jgi:hypothetical protein